MITPLVSVVVLNYNGRRWLTPCLEAVLAQDEAPAFEVLLVDNASGDGSVDLVSDRFPQVSVVQTGGNAGFAAGNNAGARQARGSLLVFLNNDTVVDRRWLGRLCAPLRTPGPTALSTSRLVRMQQPATIDSAGDGYLRAGGAFKHGHGADSARYQRSREVFGACGAAFAVRRDVFEALGGFDERFFMVYEDVDLSYRARLAGHRCWYAADAIVQHAGSGTLGRMSAAAVYYGQRNLEWTWIKNTPLGLLIRTAPAHLAYSLAGLMFYVRAGHLGAAVRGKLAALAGLSGVLRARRAQAPLRRIRRDALEPWLERGWIARKRREKAVGRRRSS